MFVQDDPTIIDMELYENLDQVVVLEWVVESGVVEKYPLMTWIDEERYRALFPHSKSLFFVIVTICQDPLSCHHGGL